MQEPGLAQILEPGAPERAALERVVAGDVSRILERGGPGLERTDVLQPTLVAASLAVARALTEAGVRPDFVAGHSVGEFAALAVAGGISPTEAIELAAARGRLMALAASKHPGGMVALLQASEESAHAALALGRRHGVVDLAAINAPDQWVVSGENVALDAIAARFPSHRLAVAGAWHSRLMAEALPELTLALRTLSMQPLKTRLVANRDGLPVTEAADLAETLAGQLVRPVLWAESLRTLGRLEVTDIVTVGPGRVLRGLIRKSLGNSARIHMTDIDLGKTIQVLKG